MNAEARRAIEQGSSCIQPRTNDWGTGSGAFLEATLGVAALRSSPAGAGADMRSNVWTQTGTIARSGGVMHYARLGDPANPPVVLLPKLGGWIADWRHVAPHLARHFHVVAIDPPGHGGSRFAGPAPCVQTLAESAAAVMAVLVQLGFGQFSVVGNSLGGCIGIAIAAF